MQEKIPQQLALLYAKYVDDKEFDKMGAIMVDDVKMGSHGFGSNTLEEFKEQLKFLDTFSATMHLIGNQLGEWDGDNYSGETYCVASHIYEKDGVPHKMEMGIRYTDSISAVGDTYKYTERYLNVVWEQDLPLTMG
ncbi:nuclear transport factor 2 family protein [Halieaceae bacterium IMCC14734]|uniref:Nuclear transport factor 2 family protein n=1 Tax=Candidatus Litorirhabdus singularis TaxID=2518993 RepID=A0ABT3TMF3_9GAMM|nr:nuclear transport factor 2 family protein [Candidatus Litorirhabdus singularis]MCX2982574.1 nuclear transport factor 2 family protein [Candidatus Litorirhabdus singularis]